MSAHPFIHEEGRGSRSHDLVREDTRITSTLSSDTGVRVFFT